MYTVELKPLIEILTLCTLRKVTLAEISLKSGVNINSLKRLSRDNTVNVTLKTVELLTTYLTNEIFPYTYNKFSYSDVFYSIFNKLIRFPSQEHTSIFQSIDLLDVILKEHLELLK